MTLAITVLGESKPMQTVPINISARALNQNLERRGHKIVVNADYDLERRIREHAPALESALRELYADVPEFDTLVKRVLDLCRDYAEQRPAYLRAADLQDEQGHGWIQDPTAIGAMCYVDLFAHDLNGLEQKLPYFKELGISYLHLMPLFKSPEGRSDGGYAVSDYRAVNPALGSMTQLAAIAARFREAGIRLVLDFIYNHTSDQHAWALKAKAGDETYRQFYFMFPDRSEPDEYEQSLREIFPEEAPGSFSWVPETNAWVWTSFKNYQWDLNYRNPNVFLAMAGEMLALANVGIEALRLDAVAFAWKQKGTPCESLEQVYTLVEAFNRVARIAAPSLLFKSEAIVHPDEVVRYIGPDRCQLSYNPLLMALLWETLATRETRLLTYSLKHRFAIDPAAQWVNYIRCHDDIGWTFSDEDAAAVGINGFDHRQFLNAFYTNRFEGGFARGVPFQFNPRTGDCRVCGSTASLAGLEKALNEETSVEADLAIKRIALMYSVIYGIGGIPLLYLGDEIAVLNDYSFRDDPHHHDDSRWVQRPRFNDEMFAAAREVGSPQHQLFETIKRLGALRQQEPVLGGHDTAFIDMLDPALFSYVRHHQGETLLALHNFSENSLSIDAAIARDNVGSDGWTDLLSGMVIEPHNELLLDPYQVYWLVKKRAAIRHD